MKRIGIMSGTFDPIHIGHVESCLVALAACELEQVLVLVEQKPHRKEKASPYSKRKDMVTLALEDFTLINLFEIDTPNITFASAMPVLKKRFRDTEFFMIIGSDMLDHLGEWQDAASLLGAIKLCVVLRENKKQASVEKQLDALKKTYPGLEYKILPAIWSPVSSSAVRQQIAKQGHSDLVHRRVLAYIQANKLYKEPKS